MCGIGAKRILELGHKTIKSEAKKLISICITLSTHTSFSRDALDFKQVEVFYFFRALPTTLRMSNDFYLRYYVGHKGKFGHEFLEFEFRPDGKLRLTSYANLF